MERSVLNLRRESEAETGVQTCALPISAEQEEVELEEFLCPVQTPPGLVGVAAALQPVPAMPLALQNISLKHLGTEIQ